MRVEIWVLGYLRRPRSGAARRVGARRTGGRCPLPSQYACWLIGSELGPSGPQTGGADLSPAARTARPVLDATPPYGRHRIAGLRNAQGVARHFRTSLKISRQAQNRLRLSEARQGRVRSRCACLDILGEVGEAHPSTVTCHTLSISGPKLRRINTYEHLRYPFQTGLQTPRLPPWIGRQSGQPVRVQSRNIARITESRYPLGRAAS